MSSSAVGAVAAISAAALAAAHWVRAARRKHEERLAALEAVVQQQRAQLREREAQLQMLRENGTSGLPVPESLYRVVLTGGPCGGKTTALAKLKERLEEFGFLVVTVPEVATLLFSGGVPLPHDEASGFAFQKHLLRLQRELEDAITALARGTGRRALVVCDRGLMDGTPLYFYSLFFHGRYACLAVPILPTQPAHPPLRQHMCARGERNRTPRSRRL